MSGERQILGTLGHGLELFDQISDAVDDAVMQALRHGRRHVTPGNRSRRFDESLEVFQFLSHRGALADQLDRKVLSLRASRVGGEKCEIDSKHNLAIALARGRQIAQVGDQGAERDVDLVLWRCEALAKSLRVRETRNVERNTEQRNTGKFKAGYGLALEFTNAG